MNYITTHDASTKDDNEAIAGNEKIDEQSQRNNIARKRIDDLLEKKRLKDLLDDEEDWDI